MRYLFLVLSSLSLLLGVIPYLKDTVSGKTKPRIVSWFNWGLLTAIASAAAISAEQYPSAVLTITSTVIVLAVAVLGFKYGSHKFETFDIFCQMGAIAGLVLWIIFNSPLTAIVFTVTIDFIAYLPTLKHAWQKPHEETPITWLSGVLGGGFSLLALQRPHALGVIYPVYITLANAVLYIVLKVRLRSLIRHNRHAITSDA